MMWWPVGGVALVYVILLVARLLQRGVTASQERELGVAPRHERVRPRRRDADRDLAIARDSNAL